MTKVEAFRSTPLYTRAGKVEYLSACLGALAYGWLIFGVIAQSDVIPFGSTIYDEMFLALLDGHLDLPARVLRFEGHFTPDGIGYLYHGLAPLLTRVVLAPFVDISATPLGSISIWFWGVLGTVFYQRTFFLAAQFTWPADGQNASIWAVLLAMAVWIGGPGLIVVSNVSLYHEPIAIAYASTAGIVYLWARAIYRGLPFTRIVVWMALLAALTVHARPNVALGLYVVVLVGCSMSLWQDRKSSIVSALLAVMLLAVGGGSYLTYNYVRFGDATVSHGSFEAGPLQYAPKYWDIEGDDEGRAETFAKQGRFNIGRVIPNAIYYTLEPPKEVFESAHQMAQDTYRKFTKERLGYVRIEGPGGGFGLLWVAWAILAYVGLGTIHKHFWKWGGLLLGGAVCAVVTLSYATITLRYHIDMWLLLVTLSAIGIGKIAPRLAAQSTLSHKSLSLIAVCFFGFYSNISSSYAYRLNFDENSDYLSTVWSEELCKSVAKRKGFSDVRIETICREPRTKY